jgi:glycosyltransferase involved in cell wall biosynthesis
MFISVLTPTYNRRNFMRIAIELFKAQTWPQDQMEWIVLDDGTDKVEDLFVGMTNVLYIAIEEGVKMKIGAKRNMLNANAKGDILVCMDDDDYYPPTRVADAVTALTRAPPHVGIAASSEVYVYFMDTKEIWVSGPFHENHGINNTMAYWRSYLNDHSYDETVSYAEEASFTDDFTAPMVQLNPESTVLMMSHDFNTFNKRTLRSQPGRYFTNTTLRLEDFIKSRAIRLRYLVYEADP